MAGKKLYTNANHHSKLAAAWSEEKKDQLIFRCQKSLIFLSFYFSCLSVEVGKEKKRQRGWSWESRKSSCDTFSRGTWCEEIGNETNFAPSQYFIFILGNDIFGVTWPFASVHKLKATSCRRRFFPVMLSNGFIVSRIVLTWCFVNIRRRTRKKHQSLQDLCQLFVN